VTIVITGVVGSEVPAGTVLTNEAVVFSDSADPNPGDESDSASTTVEALAALRVAKVDLGDPVEPTGGLLYEVVVSNEGPSDAVGVVVSDTLDADVSFVSASPGCVHDGSPWGGVVTCSLGTLPAGESVDWLIAVQVGDVPDGTVLTNGVVVGSETPDPDGGDNTDTEETVVETPLGPAADLGIEKATVRAAWWPGSG
jgi:uncharacterized repeat protein (TIGR01451 family)